MGSTGALPKDSAVKPRSNDPVVGWVDLPPEGRTGPPPPMPPCPEYLGGKWSQLAIDTWHRLWASPQATQWDENNPEGMRKWICLWADMQYGQYAPTGVLLNSMLAIEDKHGLNPYSMRRMYWRIKPKEDQETMHLAAVQPIKKEKVEY